MLTLADAVLLLQQRVGPAAATHDGMQLAAWATQQYGVLADPGSMPLCWLLLRLQQQARSNRSNGLCYCGSINNNNSSGCSSVSCVCGSNNSGAGGAVVTRCLICEAFDNLLQLPDVQDRRQ